MPRRVLICMLPLAALACCSVTPETPANVSASSEHPHVVHVHILDPNLDEDATHSRFIVNPMSDNEVQRIRDYVEPCFQKVHLPKDLGLTIWAHLATDPSGYVQGATISKWRWHNEKRADKPPKSVMEKIKQALSDPQCSKLPLPQRMLGKSQTLTYRYYSQGLGEPTSP